MNKKLFFVVLLLTGLWSQTDNIYTTISGDTVTIHHDQTRRNCCSLFDLQVTVDDSIITVTEVDTGEYCYCECSFDLSVAVTGLAAGNYTVEVFGTDSIYQTYWGSTDFTLTDIGAVNPQSSGCLTAREDTAFIELTVNGDTLNLFWDTPLLNCCLETDWCGWLNGDVFHVTMTDTGAPCDCECPFELTVDFAPLPPGTYTLDFWDGAYGYPQFTVGGSRDGLIVLNSYQSDCYGMQVETRPPNPTEYTLLQPYPNPFNPQTTIRYCLPEAAPVELAIYDLQGRLVRMLVAEPQQAGLKTVIWRGRDMQGYEVASGVYLCRVNFGNRYLRSAKLLLIK